MTILPLTSDKNSSEKWAPALKSSEVVCTVPCRSLLTPSYYHSFGMTDNYFIFIEQPFKLDILKMATAYMRGVNWASCLKFCPDESVRCPCDLYSSFWSCETQKCWVYLYPVSWFWVESKALWDSNLPFFILKMSEIDSASSIFLQKSAKQFFAIVCIC